MMKAFYEYDKLDKRKDYVNVGIYDVYAIDEEGFATAHWTIRAGSEKSAIKYVEERPDDYNVKWKEYLGAEPRYFPEVAYPMPFEF